MQVLGDAARSPRGHLGEVDHVQRAMGIDAGLRKSKDTTVRGEVSGFGQETDLERDRKGSHSQAKEVTAIHSLADGKVLESKQEKADGKPANFARQGDGRPQPVPFALTTGDMSETRVRVEKMSHLFEPVNADHFHQFEFGIDF